MLQTIGRVGVVVGQQFSGDVVISVDGKPYAFNPQCLILAPEESVTLDLKSEFILVKSIMIQNCIMTVYPSCHRIVLDDIFRVVVLP